MHPLFAQVQNSANAAAGGIFGGFFILILIVSLLYAALWIYCLINAMTRPDFDGGQRVIWALVLFLLHGIGPILYLLLTRRRL